jgi:acetyl-CoA C-acetyltransferase
MESMSNCPYLLPGARTGYRFGNAEIVDSMIRDGLWDVYNDFHMGITAELVAEKYGITRQEQDQFALESHQRAVRARKSCLIESQIIPVEIPQKKGGPVVVKYDESPREDASLEALAKLRPAFKTAPLLQATLPVPTTAQRLSSSPVNSTRRFWARRRWRGSSRRP